MRIAPEITSLVPYVPGKPIEETRREYGLSRVVKLASNENPLGASPRVRQRLAEWADDLHLYPDAASFELTQAYAKRFGLAPESLLFANGSNEIIDLLLHLVAEPGACVLTSEKAFIAYRISSQAARQTIHQLPMTPEERFDLPAMSQWLRSAAGQACRLVFLANPNNPTGTYFSHAELERFLCEAATPDRLIVLDEAYLEFARASDYPKSLELLRNHPQLVVLRTFSKAYGLAGLRLGVAIGRPEYIGYLHRLRNPFNVNLLAQRAAVVALEDQDHVRRSQELVWAGLDELASGLARRGLRFLPSQGNFLLFELGRPAQPVFEALLRRGVIVRPVANYGWPDRLRVSVGTRDQNAEFLQKLDEVLS